MEGVWNLMQSCTIEKWKDGPRELKGQERSCSGLRRIISSVSSFALVTIPSQANMVLYYRTLRSVVSQGDKCAVIVTECVSLAVLIHL